MARAPRELSTAVMLSSHGATTAAFITAVVASDSPSVIRAAVEPLLGIGDVMDQQAQVVSVHRAGPTAHLHTNIGQLPSSTTNGLLPDMTTGRRPRPGRGGGRPDPVLIQLRSLGGAVHDPAPSATAFAHRHQGTLVIASAFPPDDRATLDAAWRPSPHMPTARTWTSRAIPTADVRARLPRSDRHPRHRAVAALRPRRRPAPPAAGLTAGPIDRTDQVPHGTRRRRPPCHPPTGESA